MNSNKNNKRTRLQGSQKGYLRGQAFETMMLVISVIVALAILGFLLGILGNLSTGLGGDAKQIMREEMGKVAGHYEPGTQPREAILKPGTTIDARSVVEGTTVLQQWVKFGVSSDLTPDIIDLSSDGTMIVAKRDVKVTVVLCADPAPSSGDAKYRISITPEKKGIQAAEQCRAALG